MFLDYKDSSDPQRLRDVHNIYHMVNSCSKNVITKLADHKGNLIVHVNTKLYDEMDSHEQDMFRKRLTDIWGLFNEHTIEFRDGNDTVIH
jgi:hypothetical protein